MHHTEGIILSYYNIGEADRMLSFYTKDFGLQNIFAKSVRLTKSKFSAHTTLFSRTRISFVEGREFLRLTYAHSTDQFNIGQDKFAAASRASGLVLRLVRGQEADRILWGMLDSAFSFLRNSSEVPEDFEMIFGVRVLRHLGYVGEVPSEIRAVLENEEWRSESDGISYSLLPIFQKGLRISQL
ncbi:MAG: DNA repair protein RecO [Candidatus Niyogibacteria bacterium CG10_big_fil_rev_8_21_14_0_10_42_19]|uniref:DNA repair protein RecO n=1 Tax=Candidatus Niyogibacteria bacterium CG10_big_fil_rev_8_21_14_0_10_42_19 TaxID=1974725 RepID=A0A2H0TG96_9BACT|nr:MAG: DNA repair protein RecO [Candidatus Niyogibacteria bacterium CG10_big_fil_rev_8_21_14_0_10_42_19]